MTFGEWLPDAVLCMVALTFAAMVPQRQAAIACALAVTADWLLYVLSWTDYSLHDGMMRFGLDMKSTDLWSPIDALVAALVMTVAWEFPAAQLLWACFVAQIVGHVLYEAGYIQFGFYRDYLDAWFWGQIACFILWGFPHGRDRIARFRAGRQLRARAVSQASAR